MAKAKSPVDLSNEKVFTAEEIDELVESPDATDQTGGVEL